MRDLIWINRSCSALCSLYFYWYINVLNPSPNLAVHKNIAFICHIKLCYRTIPNLREVFCLCVLLVFNTAVAVTLNLTKNHDEKKPGRWIEYAISLEPQTRWGVTGEKKVSGSEKLFAEWVFSVMGWLAHFIGKYWSNEYTRDWYWLQGLGSTRKSIKKEVV